MIARLSALALIMVCGSSATAQDNYACQSAISSYNSAVDSISSALQRYASCVENSRGQDDCSSQFRRLRSAQSEFESAVSSHQVSCRDY